MLGSRKGAHLETVNVMTVLTSYGQQMAAGNSGKESGEGGLSRPGPGWLQLLALCELQAPARQQNLLQPNLALRK